MAVTHPDVDKRFAFGEDWAMFVRYLDERCRDEAVYLLQRLSDLDSFGARLPWHWFGLWIALACSERSLGRSPIR